MRIKELNNFNKGGKLYITLGVVFFAIAITIQIAAIKLAGGFFYSREIYSQVIFKNSDNAGDSNIYWNQISEFLTPHATGFHVGSVWTIASVFCPIFVLFVLILKLRDNVGFHVFYKSDYMRIRPPII